MNQHKTVMIAKRLMIYFLQNDSQLFTRRTGLHFAKMLIKVDFEGRRRHLFLRILRMNLSFSLLT